MSPHTLDTWQDLAAHECLSSFGHDLVKEHEPPDDDQSYIEKINIHWIKGAGDTARDGEQKRKRRKPLLEDFHLLNPDHNFVLRERFFQLLFKLLPPPLIELSDHDFKNYHVITLS
jgi:hypothetical protein